ncbi:MAG TPA: 2-amino-4-hydroxy-6-hydroxymethyldihydropteridine diphosphokinase [Verrucomicrobiae bacterium]
MVLVALGSNLGDSRKIISDAMARLQNFSDLPILKSSLWQTSPMDCPPNSPKFLNAVVGLVPQKNETPESLLKKLQNLEKEFGRAPKTILNESRPLDLDLIIFGNETRNSPELILPHPRAHLRKFVLQPLSEIAPDFILPGQWKTIPQLLDELQSRETVVLLKTATESPKFDWFGFWVHFFFGALLGALLGFSIWSQTASATSSSWMPGILLISGGAILVGLIASFMQEGFWEEFKDSSWWRWW